MGTDGVLMIINTGIGHLDNCPSNILHRTEQTISQMISITICLMSVRYQSAMKSIWNTHKLESIWNPNKL